MALTRASARNSGVASPAPAATVGTTTRAEIGDGQLCVSEIAAAGDTSEAAALAPTTTEGSLAATDTSEAAALALGITRELPAAADTEPNQSSRDAAINVGATSVKTRNRAKRQDGAGAKKEGPPPKRQRQNIAGEISKGKSKTPVPKVYIPDIIKSEEEGKNDVTELEAENAELRSKLGRSERKLGRSERKVLLLAETLAKTHESIQPLIYRTSQAAELLRKSVEIAVKQKVNKNDVEELEEMREFAWENKTVVEGLVKGGEGAIDKVLSVSPNLGKMIFFHNADAKQELAAWLNGTRPDWGTKPALGITSDMMMVMERVPRTVTMGNPLGARLTETANYARQLFQRSLQLHVDEMDCRRK